MRKHLNFVVIAFVLALSPFASGQIPNPNPDNQGNAGTNNEPPTEIIITSDALNAIQESIETIAANSAPDKAAQQNQTNREQEAINLASMDLIAQEQMAKFTRLIYIVTASGFVVGIITIICLGVNIAQTHRIVRQDRAYMTGADPVLLWLKNASGELESLRMAIPWKNTGRSPATNVRAAAKFQIIGANDNPPIFNLTKEIDADHAAPVGMDRQVSGTIFISTDEMRSCYRMESIGVIYAAVRYSDIYGREYAGEMTMRVDFLFDIDVLKTKDPGTKVSYNFSTFGTQQGERSISRPKDWYRRHLQRKAA